MLATAAPSGGRRDQCEGNGTMLEGAPDQRLYRQFAAASRAEAEAQARAASLHASVLGLVPMADRWDTERGVLHVVYAPRVSPPERRRRRLVPALLALGLVGLVGLTLALLPPSPNEGAAVARPSPSSTVRPAAPTPSPWAGPLPHYVAVECRTDWTFGRDTECGDLTVLEDRAQPDGPRITLHVAVHRTFSTRARPDPVVYLEGGPGGAPLVDGFWAYPFLDERDLIVFDQRGTGLATPSLECSELGGPFVQDELDAVRRCRDRLLARGINLAAYNSAQNAADLEDLRVALGYDSWNLYGVSYGTRLALTVLRDHPAGLRSLVLDSVYPPHVDIYAETPLNAQRAFDTLFAACAASEACLTAYPHLEERFYELVDQLDEQPIRVGGGMLGLGAFEVDGGLLLEYLFSNMYVTHYLGDLPGEIEQFLAGEWSPLEWWYDLVAETWWSSMSMGMHYSVQCTEELPFADRESLGGQPAGLRPAVGRAFEWHYMLDVCGIWEVPAANDAENLPVVSDVPVLLLAGTYDPITPPAWAEAAAEHLSAAQLVIVPGAGHAVLGTSFCVDEIVTDFLARPHRPASLDCLDELTEPVFVLPD